MIGAAQLRGAQDLLGIDQWELALKSELFLPTSQRVEASKDIVRGNADSLMKLMTALDCPGTGLIAESAVNPKGGRGFRFSRQEKGDWSGRTDDWMPLRSLAA